MDAGPVASPAEDLEALADDPSGTAAQPSAEEDTSPASPPDGSSSRGKYLELVFLVGMAGVFLVNAAVATLHPLEFSGLMARSSLGSALGLGEARWLAPAIAVNDLALGLGICLALRYRRARPALLAWLLAWSGGWLLAVSVIKTTALG